MRFREVLGDGGWGVGECDVGECGLGGWGVGRRGVGRCGVGEWVLFTLVLELLHSSV